jgi:hypothetical protein
MLDALRDKHSPTEAASARMRAGIPGLAAADATAPVAERALGTSKPIAAAITAVGVAGLVYLLWPESPAVEPAPGANPVVAPADLVDDQPRPTRVELPPQVEPSPPSPTPPKEELAPDVLQPTSPRPFATRRPTPRAPVGDPPVEASGTNPDELERELRLLAAARRHRRSGDGKTALDLLERHEVQFPRSTFEEDRELLRIQVLCDLGRLDEVRTAVDRFTHAHPRSALTSNVHGACPAGEKKEHP